MAIIPSHDSYSVEMEVTTSKKVHAQVCQRKWYYTN